MKFLEPYEQELCKTFDLVMIKGKRKLVPVILSPMTKRAIDLLNKYRDRLQVNSKFVFANINSIRSLLTAVRSWDVINRICSKLDLESPEIMTSTNFRRYVATVAQIVSLSEVELETLWNHMGHNIAIHRGFYRLPSAALEVAKISQLLMASEEGNVHKLAGKPFLEIRPKCSITSETHESDQTLSTSELKQATTTVAKHPTLRKS